MQTEKLQPLSLIGRDFTTKELQLIQEIVDLYPRLSRSELSKTVSENLSWQSPNGEIKHISCLKALEKLEARGLIKLPALKEQTQDRKKTSIEITHRTDPDEIVKGSVEELGKITIEKVQQKEEMGLWNEYIERYHYMKYKIPFGLHQRYFIRAGNGKPLGCLLFTPSAWALECRDKWIGWNANHRARNLHLIIDNSRFLIFPWVYVRNLASHTISLAAKQIGGDWEERFGYKPVLLESFVDREKFTGTCYKAANWIYLGVTKALMRKDRLKQDTVSVKDIYMYILDPNFRDALTQ